MANNSNLKKNLGLQTIYQILNTCLPLITAPYLARVLGATNLGVFSYTTSIVAYFNLLAMLGTVNYGTRSIAAVKESHQELRRVFWEIYALQVFASLISLIAYFVYLGMWCRENKVIATIQILSLIGSIMDINWLFFGIENFKITVTRSIIIKIITVCSIMLFVKTENDLWIYTFLMLMGTVLSNAVLWFYIPRVVGFEKPKLSGILIHINPNLLLFIPLLAMSIYHTMDKTMLGMLSSYEQTGFYYNADKVINIPLCVLNGVGTVMLPRMTALINIGKRQEANNLFIISMEGVAVVSVAMAFGIAAISNEFIPFFFGKGYENCIMLTIVLAPVLIIKGYSNTARTQYLVPLKLESVFIKSVFAGAVTNLIFNLMLIPRLGAMGAVIGTLLAEIVSCIWQFVYMHKTINLKKCLLNSFVYFVIGLLMFVIVRLVSHVPAHNIVKIVCEIISGGVFYIVSCIIFWKFTKNEMYKTVFSGIISRIPLLKRIL